MFESGVIDVAIGIALLYLLISVMCSAFTEAISRFLNLRAKFLVLGIRQMMSNASLADDVLTHPLVTGIKEPEAMSFPSHAFRWLSKVSGGGMGQGFPSYLGSSTFRASLVDQIVGLTQQGQDLLRNTSATAEQTLAALRAGVDSLSEGVDPKTTNLGEVARLNLQRTLRTLLRDAGDDLTKAQTVLERWFDQSMERVSGWYKRNVRWFLIAAAVFIVGALNADTVRIGISLWQDQAVRAQVVALAGNAASQEFPPDTAPLRNGLTDLKLIGWRSNDPGFSDPRELPDTSEGWIYKLGGLLLTIVAVQQGANYWFDLLKKLINVRGAGAPPPSTISSAAVPARGAT